MSTEFEDDFDYEEGVADDEYGSSNTYSYNYDENDYDYDDGDEEEDSYESY